MITYPESPPLLVSPVPQNYHIPRFPTPPSPSPQQNARNNHHLLCCQIVVTFVVVVAVVVEHSAFVSTAVVLTVPALVVPEKGCNVQ